ncbi:hypothetical protein DL546_007775 [Coniochaeta pulveracea]|uniref:Uncharacterized protein n=1 Tax=Coniochaeta pulveracea TaxID=177199 RepID=A0A420YM39_9PEZI|nr:hypothetical protein DL546_007775 [Coniochaeta pulveracea]
MGPFLCCLDRPPIHFWNEQRSIWLLGTYHIRFRLDRQVPTRNIQAINTVVYQPTGSLTSAVNMQSVLKLVFLLPVVLVAAKPVELAQTPAPQDTDALCLPDCTNCDDAVYRMCMNAHPYCTGGGCGDVFGSDLPKSSCKCCTCDY